MKLWKAWLADLLNLFFPPACLVCGHRLVDQKLVICEACEARVALVSPAGCPVCGSENQNNPCEVCAEEHFAFSSVRSVFKYRGPVKDLIHELKYNGYNSPAGYFAVPLGELIESDPELQDHDFLCPVPLHRVRQRERGYNQSELIAYAASVISGMPYAEPLKRRFYTRSQTLLSRAKRHKNLLNAFKVINANDVKGKRIIVVDDVFTTGSTLNEIAKTLLAAGAGKVTALTVARA